MMAGASHDDDWGVGKDDDDVDPASSLTDSSNFQEAKKVIDALRTSNANLKLKIFFMQKHLNPVSYDVVNENVELKIMLKESEEERQELARLLSEAQLAVEGFQASQAEMATRGRDGERDLATKLVETQKSLQLVEEESAFLKEQVSELLQDMKDKESEIQALKIAAAAQAELSAKASALEGEAKARAAAETELKESAARMLRLDKELAGVREELESERRKRSHLKARYAEDESLVDKLKGDLAAAKRELAEEEDRHVRTRSLYKDATVTVVKLEADLARAVRRAEAMRDDADLASRKECVQLRAECSQLRSDCSQARAEATEMREAAAAAQKEAERADGALKSAQREVESSRVDAQASRMEADRLRAEVEEERSAHERTKAKYRESAAEFGKEVGGQVARLRDELAAERDAHAATEAKLASTSASFSRAQGEVARLRDQLDLAHAALQESERTSGESARALQGESMLALQRARSDLASVTQQLATATQQLEAERTAHSRTQELNHATVAQCNRLLDEVARLKKGAAMGCSRSEAQAAVADALSRMDRALAEGVARVSDKWQAAGDRLQQCERLLEAAEANAAGAERQAARLAEQCQELLSSEAWVALASPTQMRSVAEHVQQLRAFIRRLQGELENERRISKDLNRELAWYKERVTALTAATTPPRVSMDLSRGEACATPVYIRTTSGGLAPPVAYGGTPVGTPPLSPHMYQGAHSPVLGPRLHHSTSGGFGGDPTHGALAGYALASTPPRLASPPPFDFEALVPRGAAVPLDDLLGTAQVLETQAVLAAVQERLDKLGRGHGSPRAT
eukprot:jgi/Mesvir1/25425/Mv01707-RA.1